jgi:hypothetical protein
MAANSEYSCQATALIHAAPQVVYATLADYINGHPRIVPPQYFTGIEVVKGGIGAGTEIKVGMKAGGVKTTLYLIVTEPQPGYILQETDKNGQFYTHFILEPHGEYTQLTILTVWKQKKGLGGIIEKYLNQKFGYKIFSLELQCIDSYCSVLK